MDIKYPVGIQSFSEVRCKKYTYVDKTGFLRSLLESGSKYVFLSRPRRFGKSLFLSMTEDFFRGRRELFDGLDISSFDWDWQIYPVLHFDLSGCAASSDDSLVAFLSDSLAQYEKLYDIPSDPAKQPGLRLKEIIIQAHFQTGRQVVILIDEYDKPLLDTVENPQRQELFRQQLRPFYANLKSQDRHIEFAMLTGVAKFGHLSIFSDTNNLEDISLNEDYSAICGITTDELHEYFHAGVEALAAKLNISAGEAYELLRLNYDGYHFSPENAPDIYNPFSIINALKSRKISNYWFQTGTPTFLIKLIRKRGMQLQRFDRIDINADSISSVAFDLRSSLVPVLYQSGYLTIKSFRPLLNTVSLGFPNREVQQGFYNQLFKIYIPSAADSDTEFSIAEFYDDLAEGRPDSFMTRLQSFFADFNYDGFNRIEIEQHYQDVVFILMKLMGVYVNIEYRTACGRIDLVVKTPEYIYVFEFKISKSAKAAMEQIDSREYLLPFKADGRKLVKIGANFSDQTHTLNEWLIENC